MGMNIKLGWDNANKPVAPGIAHLSSMVGLTPGGGPAGPGGGGGATSAGVASLMRNTSLASASPRPSKSRTSRKAKAALKRNTRSNSMTSPVIFDRRQVRANRLRAAADLSKNSFLFDWAMKNLVDRLAVVRRRFPLALQMGARSSPEHTNALAEIAAVNKSSSWTHEAVPKPLQGLAGGGGRGVPALRAAEAC